MRLFIGIELSEDVRSALALEAGRLGAALRGRYSDPSNYHITLAFLGQHEQDELRIVEHAMRAAAVQSGGTILLDRMGSFRKGNRAVVWHGGAPDKKLLALHGALMQALRDDDIAFSDGEGRYQPHVTLARECPIAPLLPRDEWASVELTYDHITLFESARDAMNVLRYTPLYRCDLNHDC